MKIEPLQKRVVVGADSINEATKSFSPLCISAKRVVQGMGKGQSRRCLLDHTLQSSANNFTVLTFMNARTRERLSKAFTEHRTLSRKGPWPINDQGVTCLLIVDDGLVEQYCEIGPQKQTLALHYPRDGIVHWYPRKRLRGAVTSRLRVADPEEVRDLVSKDAGIGSLVRAEAQRQFEIASQWLHVLGSLGSEQKLAHFICEHAWRLGVDVAANEPFYIPRQKDIADALSMTGIHVNRLLKSLETAGLIKRQLSRTSIPDWKELARLGKFREGYLQQGDDICSHRRECH